MHYSSGSLKIRIVVTSCYLLHVFQLIVYIFFSSEHGNFLPKSILSTYVWLLQVYNSFVCNFDTTLRSLRSRFRYQCQFNYEYLGARFNLITRTLRHASYLLLCKHMLAAQRCWISMLHNNYRFMATNARIISMKPRDLQSTCYLACLRSFCTKTSIPRVLSVTPIRADYPWYNRKLNEKKRCRMTR